MSVSKCTKCGVKLRHPEDALQYRCPRCKTLAVASPHDRAAPCPPLRVQGWRVPFNDGWAGMSVLVAVTFVVSAAGYQFKPDEKNKAEFLVIALTVAGVAAIVVNRRIRRFRTMFERGTVLQACVTAHALTEKHIGKVHTTSTLSYEYDFRGQHYNRALPQPPLGRLTEGGQKTS